MQAMNELEFLRNPQSIILNDDINSASPNGKTALMILASGLSIFSNKKFSENAESDIVIKKNIEREAIISLLGLGANMDIRNPYTGETATHYCVKEDRVDLLKIFINRGASIHIKDYAGINLIHLAVKYDSINCLGLLLSTFVGDINSRDNVSGESPIVAAVKNFNFTLLENLIIRGCNLNIVDNNGMNVLHWAAKIGNFD
ncbi:MAG: negative regulation of growth rate, partial [Paramarteilia canceri]